jgi:hypothetical protein
MKSFEQNIGNQEVDKIERKVLVETNENVEKDNIISIDCINNKPGEKELTRSDNQDNINLTKEKINQSFEKRKRYSFLFKPEDVWNEKDEEYTKNPINKITDIFKRFSKKEKEKRKIQKNNENDFINDNKKYQKISFNYKPGDGVLGMVGNNVGILANNFRDCSSLVFQGRRGVSIIHISPEALNQYSDFNLRDSNIYGHISSALKEIINNNLSNKKTMGDFELNPDEIQELQKLFDSGDIKATMIHSENKLSLELPINLATMGNSKKLPFFKTESYYVGGKSLGTEFSVYVNPENIYVIGENNRIMKKGVDFPKTIIDFKERL